VPLGRTERSTDVVSKMRPRRRAVGALLLVVGAFIACFAAPPALAGTAEEVSVLPTLDALSRSESPLSSGGKWAALAWDTGTSTTNTGLDETAGWRPANSFSTVNGAYWTPATFNDTSGDAASVTMSASPGISERYVSLWLDMPSPGSAKTGYQLRWTMTATANVYSVTLSRWSAGAQTVLASNASVTIAPGTTLAISDTGATVGAWQSSGGAFSSLLSAADTTLSSGFAGIEASGSNSHSTNFKAGMLLGPAISSTTVLDNLERTEVPFAAGGKWSKTSWAEAIGGAWGSPYRGYGGTGLSGAYWNPSSFSDGGETLLTAATVGTGSPYSGEYLGLWLDMPNPGAERSGYEARFTGTNGTATAYTVELSKWVAGTRTVLASSSGFSLPVGTTIALTETAGGAVALWSGTGASMTPLLSAADTTYTSGYAGLEVKGGAGTLYNFRAGQVFNQPPDTSVTAGPKGGVLPNVAFSFTASKAGASFECSLDGAAYAACVSPSSYSGPAEGAHTFKVRAIGSGGKDETPAERSFQVVAPAKATSRVAVLDNLERSEHPFPAGGKWSKTSWATEIGGAWMEGWRGYGSNSGLSGAYWNPATFSDNGESQLIAATVGTGATPTGQYFGLWLDMPNPASERTGYEARFTGTNGTATAYTVELSKWVAGARTVLASSSGFSLPVGTTMALSETANGTLTLWTGTSSAMTQTLTATDTTYTSGYAGLEVNGGAGTLYNFRAGRMDLTAPNTTISSGPSGVVLPENVSFTFTATEGATSFECSLDGAAYSACTSPKAYPGLVSGSSHTFKVRAVDAVGNQDETPAERSFQVVVLPSATTNAATSVKATEATLQASVNPNGAETKYQFEYGTTTSYGSKAPTTAKAIGNSSTAVEASQAITGLTPGTTYHYRVAATNAAGTSRGEDRTFTTAAAPAALTEAATGPTATSATLNAAVNPKGAETTYQFEYGTTTAYGSQVPITAKSVGAGANNVAVSETPTGLAEGTTYHYRIAATNEVGTTYGADQTFSTLTLPLVATLEATNIEGTDAELHGTVNPDGSLTSYKFEYGTSTAYGASEPLPSEGAGGGVEPVEAFEVIEALEPHTTYHYRVVASSSAGTAVGEDRTFTTGERSAAEEGEKEPTEEGSGGGGGSEGGHTSGTGGGGGLPGEFMGMMWGGGWEQEPKEMLAIKEYGAHILRYDLTPSGSEGTYEKVFELAAKDGLTVLPYLDDSTGQYPTREGWSNYDSWIEKVVKRYGPSGSFWNGKSKTAPAVYWEVWNEPNRGHNNPGGVKVNAKLFGEFLNAASNAIAKASENHAKVILGGLLSQAKNTEGAEEEIPPGEFVRGMNEADRASFVAVGLHPYVFQADNGAAPTTEGQVNQVVAKVKRNIKTTRDALDGIKGTKGDDIWITELGWPVRENAGETWPHEQTFPPVTEHIQSELIEHAFRMMKDYANNFGIRHAFYYNDRNNGVGTWEYKDGLREYSSTINAHVRRESAYAYEKQAGVKKWPTPPPTHTTGATPQSRKATASGAVKPEGMGTFFRVEYGTEAKHLSLRSPRVGEAEPEAGYEEAEVPVQRELTGLAPNTTYYYRFVATNENGESEAGEERQFKTQPSTETFATVISHNGRPGWVTVEGHVLGEHSLTGDYVNVNFWKKEGGKFVFKEEESTHANIENNAYKLEKWSIGEGEWKVVVVFPGFGEDLRSESGEHEFTIQAIPTETFLTLTGYANGTPGTASVSGNVQHNGVGISGTVNVNFQKLVSGTWTTMSTATRTLSNGHYEVLNWGVGVGQWRVRAVFPNQEEYAGSESEYHEFSIQPVSTETFLTLNGTANGTPGTASVSGNVLHNGAAATGTVNVNFQKLISGTWQTMSTATRTLSNGHYEVLNWGVGVGQWRVRAVFPEQGDYSQSESSYHEFSIQPVSTETFLTLNGTANGAPGSASVSGYVLHNGAGASGTVNVNFEKWNGSAWQTMSTAQRVLSGGYYEVAGWGVGVGYWRVRAVFPEQGDYAQSESNYHEFSISPAPTEAFLTVSQVVKGKPGSVSVYGNVLHNGAGVPGYVNVNFEKWNGSAWQLMSYAQPGLSNGHYEVNGWGVGAGSWRVRVVFPEQGEYLGSTSEYHEFTI